MSAKGQKKNKISFSKIAKKIAKKKKIKHSEASEEKWRAKIEKRVIALEKAAKKASNLHKPGHPHMKKRKSNGKK